MKKSNEFILPLYAIIVAIVIGMVIGKMILNFATGGV